MTTKRRKKTSIDIILSRVQNLQTSCFGTPISVTIEASRGVSSDSSDKMIFVTTATTDKSKTYLISSDMPNTQIYQKWGDVKDDVSKLLDQYVGHKINKHGREVQG